ncbi:hypothetical protein CVT25_003068 [Psilocybe cyanescens]|uniref:DNA polymerase lambda n=1 Tax=Psilocybe cyanescens TaxID=93625 RepID=A0A409X4U6_PSICY|nr:hypothetical protein CVT25_003068 [Psilocybe cyanescens]
MSQFNLKQYYAEQDEHMNLPEETVDEYLKRTATFRRSQSSDTYASSSRIQYGSFLRGENAIPGAASAPATTPLALHKIIPPSEDRGNASESLEPAVQKGSIRAITSDQDEMPLAPSSSIPKQSDEGFKTHEPSSQSLEDIDSFTIDLCDAQISPSEAKTGKRKPVSSDARRTAQKKRRIDLADNPQVPEAASATQQSPISSFSTSIIHSPKKARPVKRNEEGPPAPRPVVPLSLVPQVLQKHTKPVKMALELPTSPIEDPSMVIDDPPSQSPTEKKRLKGGPSKLLVDMQKRIAKFAGQQTAKVIKVGPKPAIRKATRGKSTALPAAKSAVANISSFPFPRAKSPEFTSRQNNLMPNAKPTKGKKPAVAQKPAGRPSMTGAECARKVLADAASNVIKIKKWRRLEGTNILYVGADATHATVHTEGEMTTIVRNGGNLMPDFDPDITTHIVAAENDYKNVLKATGLPRLRDIPEKIPIVTWDWVEKVIEADTTEEVSKRMLETWVYPSFICRKPLITLTPMASLKNRPEFNRILKANSTAIVSNMARGPARPLIGSSTSLPVIGQVATAATSALDNQLPSTGHEPGALLSPPTSPVRPTEIVKASSNTEIGIQHEANDPLAEFYDQAREQKEREEGWSSSDGVDMMEKPDTDENDESEPEEVHSLPPKKRGWTCDAKVPQAKIQCPNQDIIDKLDELRKIHEAKVGNEHRWRVFALNKAIRALRSHPRRIKGFEDANRIQGIGEKTARKIAEILETGGLRRIAYENSEDVQVNGLFRGIYGVGQTIALRWYLAGCRTLEDLKVGKGGVKLSAVQKIGLQFYDDINDRMPRAEAKHIYDLIKPIALSIDSQLFIDIMGSYRRGKADCGDIDILITRPTDDGSTHRGVLSQLLLELHKVGIITEDLALPDDPDDLEATYRGLCRPPGVEGARRRRIDILTVPWTSKGAALLYYTGDDIFNRAMRLKANYMGYSLNQKGLFANVVRDPHDRRIKLNNGQIVASETEEEIFKILGVPWQEPHERVRG